VEDPATFGSLVACRDLPLSVPGISVAAARREENECHAQLF